MNSIYRYNTVTASITLPSNRGERCSLQIDNHPTWYKTLVFLTNDRTICLALSNLFLATHWLEFLPSDDLVVSPLQPRIQYCDSRERQSKQEQRDQVPLPCSHDRQVMLNIRTQTSFDQRQLQHCLEPGLRRPTIVGICDVVRVRSAVQRSGSSDIDALSMGLVRDCKSICERRKSEESRQDGLHEPRKIEVCGQSHGFAARRCVMAESEYQDASEADEHEGGAGGAVAGVALVEEEVLGFAV